MFESCYFSLTDFTKLILYLKCIIKIVHSHSLALVTLEPPQGSVSRAGNMSVSLFPGGFALLLLLTDTFLISYVSCVSHCGCWAHGVLKKKVSFNAFNFFIINFEKISYSKNRVILSLKLKDIRSNSGFPILRTATYDWITFIIFFKFLRQVFFGFSQAF